MKVIPSIWIGRDGVNKVYLRLLSLVKRENLLSEVSQRVEQVQSFEVIAD